MRCEDVELKLVARKKLPFQIFEDFFSDIAYYFYLAMSATSSQPGSGALPFNEQGRTKNGRRCRDEDGSRGLGHPSLCRSRLSCVLSLVGGNSPGDSQT